MKSYVKRRPGHVRSNLAAPHTLAAIICAILHWPTIVQAAPVVAPGELLGVELGIPQKPGLYLFNTTSYGGMTDGSRSGFNIPILLASLPNTVLGARIEPFMAQPNLFGKRVGDGLEQAGIFNTLVGIGAAWQVSKNIGFSYLVGVYAPSDTTIAFASGSTRQDFALTYDDKTYSTTAHLTYGTMFNNAASFGAGRPIQRNADYVNIELSALHKFGDFEVGPVALGTTDLSVPRSFLAAGYARSGRFALGGLSGYDFGSFRLQAYLTHDVAQRGAEGPDIRGWVRIIVPLWK